MRDGARPASLRADQPSSVLLTPSDFARFLSTTERSPPRDRRCPLATYSVPAGDIDTPSLTEHTLALHLGGDAPVMQWLGERTIRRSLRRGAGALGDLATPLGGDDALVEQILLALLAVSDAEDAATALYVDALVHALTLHVLRAYTSGPARLDAPPDALSSPRLALVIDYIEANLDQRLELAGLASIAGLSVFHFARVFRSSLGASPHRYLLERRIGRAKGLLAAGRLPIIEIAAACGFAGPSHFATAFRRLTRRSPRAYRREAQGRA